MRMLSFAGRTTREIIRDPLNMIFGAVFPVLLMSLMCIIQLNIPVDIFNIENLAPGIAVFGLSFMSLFSGMLIAKDRETSFFQRLYATPMKSMDFIMGYTLPVLAIALLQAVICYLAAFCWGMEITWNIFLGLLAIIPCALFFIGVGLLCGSTMKTQAVSGICGALITNLTALASGIWFDLELMGNTMNRILHWLPFAHAVELQRAAVHGLNDDIGIHLAWVLGYAVVIIAFAVFFFLRQTRKK